MLTPLLVTIELLVCLLLGQKLKAVNTISTKAHDAKGNTAVCLSSANTHTWHRGQPVKEEPKENVDTAFKALGFLGCLLLWGMCGTYAWFGWKREQMMVRSCLERGNLLSTCLPCFVTSISSVQRTLFWALPATGLFLALTALVTLALAKLGHRIRYIEATYNNFDAPEVSKMHKPMLEKEKNLSNHCNVDLDNICCKHSLLPVYNKRPWASGNYYPLVWIEELADSCMSKNDRVMLGFQPQCTVRATLQSLHPHRSWIWQTLEESPSLRVQLTTGLLCGLLVCVFPTVLSTNILLVSSLDTLVVYIVRQLLSATH